MCVYLCAKFQVSSIIPPPQNEPLIGLPRLGINKDLGLSVWIVIYDHNIIKICPLHALDSNISLHSL